MSQLTAAANFSRMQSLCKESTAGGGGGGRRCCCGGGDAVLMVSTHAATSECPIPSAAYRRISTSRRLRDGRATAARRIRDDRATALRGRTWRDRCGVANAMTPVSSRQFVGSLAAPPQQESESASTAFDATAAPRPSERSTVLPMQPLLPGLRRTGHEGPVDAPDQASRCGARRRSEGQDRSSATSPTRLFNNNDKKEVLGKGEKDQEMPASVSSIHTTNIVAG